MSYRYFPPLIVGILFPILTQCTTQRSYWVADPNKPEEAPATPLDWAILPHETEGVKHHKPFHKNLRVIEYDDMGDRWETMQVVAARKLIREVAPGTPVVVFIHGWRNNAHPKCRDFLGFNSALYDLEKTSPTKEIVGIYIGWRGASVDERVKPLAPVTTVPAFLSFLERRPATSRVAGVPLVSDLWKIRRDSLSKESRLILVGHSFGGRILEHVVAQSVVAYHSQRPSERAIETVNLDFPDDGGASNRRYRESLIADLSILINPASESLSVRQLKIALRTWPEVEPPAIINISANTDSANKIAWPIGKSIERAFSPLRPLPSRQYRLYHHVDLTSMRKESQWEYEKTTAQFHPTRQVNGFVRKGGGEPKRSP